MQSLSWEKEPYKELGRQAGSLSKDRHAGRQEGRQAGSSRQHLLARQPGRQAGMSFILGQNPGRQASRASSCRHATLSGSSALDRDRGRQHPLHRPPPRTPAQAAPLSYSRLDLASGLGEDRVWGGVLAKKKSWPRGPRDRRNDRRNDLKYDSEERNDREEVLDRISAAAK